MSPTIRIDEDVYAALQARAEAFVDTPNSVLRQLLDLREVAEELQHPIDGAPNRGVSRPRTVTKNSSRSSKTRTKKRSRVPTGTVLREESYEIPLLAVLEEEGGSGPASEIIQALGARLADQLLPNDRRELKSGAIRWQNRAQFVRLRLVQRGDMAGDSPRGIWAISEQGRKRLEDETV